jgi:DNA-binding NarL/FixJ family response regulator
MRWVLIVEDHALFREGLALLLKWRTGLDNVQSGSIDEARRILGDAKEEPVCAVLDLDLPDGDGVELLERLRGLPVVALVSERSLETLRPGVRSGGRRGAAQGGVKREDTKRGGAVRLRIVTPRLLFRLVTGCLFVQWDVLLS